MLLDVNVLIYAFRSDSLNHLAYHDWLKSILESDQAFGISDLVLSGYLRIVTNPRIFRMPTSLGEALSFIEAVRTPPHCVYLQPGPSHWDIFTRLCKNADTKGNHVADAYLAALAIETGSEWITTDRDYARFPDLRWRHPLQF